MKPSRKLFRLKFLVRNSAQKALLSQNLQDYAKDIARYDKEKADIKKQAEGTNKENALVVRRGGSIFFGCGIFPNRHYAFFGRGSFKKKRNVDCRPYYGCYFIGFSG